MLKEYFHRINNGYFKMTSNDQLISSQFMDANDFIKDREAFNQIMQLNGFDTKGRFTLDGEGNPIVYE